MDFEKDAKLQSAMADALVEAGSDRDWAIGTTIRIVRDGAKRRMDLDLVVPGRGRKQPTPSMMAAARAITDAALRNGHEFVQMNAMICTEDEGRIYRTATGYEDSRPRGRAFVEGDRWPISLTQLHEQHAFVSELKQSRLAAVVGESRLALDRQAGVLDWVDAGLRCEYHVLGTAGARTWLWAWANEESFSAPMRAPSERLRACGKSWCTPELVAHEIPNDAFVGRAYAQIACGVLGYEAYWAIPIETIHVWVLLRSPALAQTSLVSPLGVSGAVHELTVGPPVHHRRALSWGAATLGLPRRGSPPDPLQFTIPTGDVRVSFDADGRIAEMSVPMG